MKIKLSKSQWEEMGKKAGWIKKAYVQMPFLPTPSSSPHKSSPFKKSKKTVAEWKGEDNKYLNLVEVNGMYSIECNSGPKLIGPLSKEKAIQECEKIVSELPFSLNRTA